MAVAPGLREYTARSGKRAQPSFGLRAKKTTAEAVRQANLFLTQKIGDIKGSELCSLNRKDYEYNESENIAYLEETVSRYCQIHELDFKYERSGKFWKDVLSLYEIVECGWPDKHEVTLEYNEIEKRFILKESGDCSFPDYQLFFFPIGFIERLEGDIRTLALTFVKFMQIRCGFCTPYEHFDFCASLGLFDADDWRMSEMITEYGDEEFNWVEGYNEGNIKHLFDELEEVPGNGILETLHELLLNAKPKDGWEHKMVSVMEEGMMLMEDNCLYHYFPDVNSEDVDYYDEGCYLDFERMFCLCYGEDCNDVITDMTIRNFNMDAQDLVMLEMKDCTILKPDSTEVFYPSDFPQKWADWYQQFYQIISLDDE